MECKWIFKFSELFDESNQVVLSLIHSDAAETNAIAKLPNREGMLSMFAGALTSTLSGLAVAMQAYADKQEEPAA